MRLVMVYHENGGNESFEVGGRGSGGGVFSTLKAFSDPNMSHNFILLFNDELSENGPSDGRELPLGGVCADRKGERIGHHKRRGCIAFKYLAGNSRRCWTTDETAQCLSAGCADSAVMEGGI